jgi:hypothetical protein
VASEPVEESDDQPPLAWDPKYELPADSVIAIPARGWAVFRLVKHNPPNADDFRAMTRSRAERTNTGEIYRLGLSHYMRAENAYAVRTNPDSMVAKVMLRPNRRIHVARTEPELPGHLDVWGPVEVLLEDAQVLEEGL